jgi:hypothetical protein
MGTAVAAQQQSSETHIARIVNLYALLRAKKRIYKRRAAKKCIYSAAPQ